MVMKKFVPNSKEAFAAMCMREYGFSEKLANDAAAIVAGYGAFGQKNLRCKGKVPYPQGEFRQCQFKAKYGDYCRQHAPKSNDGWDGREEYLDTIRNKNQ